MKGLTVIKKVLQRINFMRKYMDYYIFDRVMISQERMIYPLSFYMKSKEEQLKIIENDRKELLEYIEKIYNMYLDNERQKRN